MPAEGACQYSWPLSRRSGVHHELGEYEKELELARLGYEHPPNDGAFFGAGIGALIGCES